jgi:hypothetical protein
MLLTGATAVCIVCYVIPVALHLKIYFSPGAYKGLHQQRGAAGNLSAPLLQVNTLASTKHMGVFTLLYQACALPPTWTANDSLTLRCHLQDGRCTCGGCEVGRKGGACSCRQEEPDCSRVAQVGAPDLCTGRRTMDNPAGRQYQAHSAWRRARWRNLHKCWEEVVIPVAVVVLGVGFSVAALWVSLSQALWPKHA